ncbi:ABC transporter ATP-binding protein, partial [Streptomyces sp. CHA1]|nr:ABC transporter ATP-binding protein [Streptomyces sp. CHA1]
SMDLYSERNLLNLLNELKAEGKTILIAAHKLSLIRNADQILVLDGGRIRETGTHSELINMGGNYNELWNYQNQDNFF